MKLGPVTEVKSSQSHLARADSALQVNNSSRRSESLKSLHADRSAFYRLLDWFSDWLGITNSKSKIIVDVQHLQRMPDLESVKPNPVDGLPRPYIYKVAEHGKPLSVDFIQEHTELIFVLAGNSAANHLCTTGMGSLIPAAEKLAHDRIVVLPTCKNSEFHARKKTHELYPWAFRDGTESETQANLAIMNRAIDKAIRKSLETGKQICMVWGGYGTGASGLPILAPKTFHGLNYLLCTKLGLIHQTDPSTGLLRLVHYEEALQQQQYLREHSELLPQKPILGDDDRQLARGHAPITKTSQLLPA